MTRAPGTARRSLRARGTSFGLARQGWLAVAACVLAGSAVATEPTARETACAARAGISVQVLGSGGPIADDARASSGYVVWVDGRSRLVVDAGGGVFQRFGAAKARLEDLDAIVLSHLHTDHSADFPALVKSLYFADRPRPLVVVGPDGDGAFPALDDYLTTLFGPGGAYAYLGGALRGSGGLPRLRPVVVPHTARMPIAVASNVDDLTLDAVGVRHGIVPTIAVRAKFGGRTIVFASDQSARNPHMPAFARGADLLIVHAAVPENAGSGARSLHRTPSEIAALIKAAAPARVLVSHWMQRSLAHEAEVIASIDAVLPGRVVAARDLACVPVAPAPPG